MQMLAQFRGDMEIVVVISADDIEANKMRHDVGISYQEEVFRIRAMLARWQLSIAAVVITRYRETDLVHGFCERLRHQNIPFYRHYEIANYPQDIDMIISEEGYGKNDSIATLKPLIVVTGP